MEQTFNLEILDDQIGGGTDGDGVSGHRSVVTPGPVTAIR